MPASRSEHLTELSGVPSLSVARVRCSRMPMVLASAIFFAYALIASRPRDR